MTKRCTIIPATEIARRRQERTRLRREREARQGSILDLLDNEDEEQSVCGVASEQKERRK